MVIIIFRIFLGIPYFLAPFYSIILLTATTTYMQMEPQFQLQLSGCINQQNPVKQNPLSISCLRAIDYAVLIFFTVFMLSGLFLFVFRIVNKKVYFESTISGNKIQTYFSAHFTGCWSHIWILFPGFVDKG